MQSRLVIVTQVFALSSATSRRPDPIGESGIERFQRKNVFEKILGNQTPSQAPIRNLTETSYASAIKYINEHYQT
jgi:hypothetical protein